MDSATPTNDEASAGSFGLPGRSLCTLLRILASQGAVEQAIVYGSRAKGNFRPGSDIDLTLVAPTSPGQT